MASNRRGQRVVEQISVVPAPIDDVWDRVASLEGIGHELGPWVTMSVPPGAEGMDITTVPIGVPLGRSWLRLLGVIPFDYDDLTIAALDPGHSFPERSTMLSASRWVHERELTAVDGGTQVHDRLIFTSRIPLGSRLHARIVQGLFAHRHRRLARHFV